MHEELVHIGSHEAAQNLAFMYSLYQSCKMNDLNFGLYIEDILTRIMNGDEDYLAMLPITMCLLKKKKKSAHSQNPI